MSLQTTRKRIIEITKKMQTVREAKINTGTIDKVGDVV